MIDWVTIGEGIVGIVAILAAAAVGNVHGYDRGYQDGYEYADAIASALTRLHQPKPTMRPNRATFEQMDTDTFNRYLASRGLDVILSPTPDEVRPPAPPECWFDPSHVGHWTRDCPEAPIRHAQTP